MRLHGLFTARAASGRELGSAAILSSCPHHFSRHIWRRCRARACRRVRSREVPCIQANELNVWGDTDGRDEDAGEDDDGFDKDTGAVILRVLTARATQKLLMQLSELDIHVSSWLSNYVSEHKPLEGNKPSGLNVVQFLLELFKAPVATLEESTSDTAHFVNPADLATRILALRADMAKRVMARFDEHVARDNIELMRKHLESSSYVSGSYIESRPRDAQDL